MKTTLSSLALLISALLCPAENARYVTVATTNNPASIQILEGETGQLVSSYTASAYTRVLKNGIEFPAFTVATDGSPTTISGPATFELLYGSAPAPAYMTVKIIPESYDPNKTLIVPPGTNQVLITLETSTNLVSWATATNGVYGSPEVAQFFRIKMSPLSEARAK